MSALFGGGVFESLSAGFFGASAGVSTKLTFDNELLQDLIEEADTALGSSLRSSEVSIPFTSFADDPPIFDMKWLARRRESICLSLSL